MLIDFEKEIYYDEKHIINCPYCNIIIFYINKSWEHECFMKNNEKFVINKIFLKNRENKFLRDINKIENRCIKHNEEFLYYKNSNYYCIECLKEKKFLKNFITLENIILSKEEINNYFYLIIKFENILLEVKKINEDLILKTD